MAATELHNVLHTALRELRAIEAKEGAEPKEPMKAYEAEDVKIDSVGELLKYVGYGVLFVLFGGFFGLLFSKGSWTGALIGCLVGAAIYIFMMVFFIKSGKKNAPKVTATHEQWEIDHATWKTEFNALLKGVAAAHMIPAKYCNEPTLEYMIELVNTGRATTWTECADKFEE